MSSLSLLRPADVRSADDLARYAEQVMGVPWARQRDLVVLKAKCNELFAHYPTATWFTLCRVVEYCRARKRRVPRVWMIVEEFRNAWAAGWLPELDPGAEDPEVEAGIAEALEQEDHEGWRRRLLGARGRDARRAVLMAWREVRC